MKNNVRRLTTVGILSAIAFAVTAVGRIPIVEFLKYDPKDIIITLSGLIMGTVPAVLVTVLASFLEMITISSTGAIGFMMNVLATCSFVIPAVLIYKKYHSKLGAVVGLIGSVLLMTAVMLLWNYIMTPIFLEMPREKIVPIIWRAILPFNLLKGGLNAAFVLLLYKPITNALRKYSIIHSEPEQTSKYSPVLFGFALLIIVTCVFIILAFKGII